MIKEELLQQVEDVIVNTFEIDRALIKSESKLVEDLDFDSIDAIELVLQLEDKYDAKISAEKLKSSKTVQDVVDYLYELLMEQDVPVATAETS